MKKNITASLIVLLMLSASLSLSAQDEGDNGRVQRDEIRIGWSLEPLFFKNLVSSSPYYMTYGYNYGLGDAYPDKDTEKYSAGVFSIEYNHFIKDWLSISVDGGFTPLWVERKNAFDVKLPNQKGVIFYVVPKVRFSYLRTDLVTLYSDVGIGLCFGPVKGDFVLYPMFHSTPVGITVGRKVYGFAETNLSMKNVGFTCGAGIRF